jgi:predicted ATPase
VIGREREIAVVLALLDPVPRGPRALLVDGEAGIGKSTVWFEAVRLAEARGYRVLRARPAESEAKLSYATLAAALLRVTSSEPADPRTVATAAVGVLTELVCEQPVLVAIDDVQWVDLASRRALEFAARRLPAQLRLFVTRRSVGAADVPLELDRALPPDAFKRVVLGSLSLASLHHIVRERLGTSPTRP